MRIPLLTRSAVALLVLSAACTQDRIAPTTPPTTPPGGGTTPPTPIGVFEVHLTGIGTDDMSSTARAVRDPAEGPSAVLTPIASGLQIEQVSASSFIDGARGGGGQRYVQFTYRVRNGTGGALSNLAILPVARATTISGTPISSMTRFDGGAVPSTVALQVAPTGAVALGSDLVTMQGLYPDVLQAYTEAEIASIAAPAGVTSIFPVGWSVRSKNTNANRTLPATSDPNQWDGLFTLSIRLPLQASATQDVFSVTVSLLAITDSEVKLTESIEEAQDTGAVRRLRDRATTLGATTVTVLNGSSALDPAVPDYPGQRLICSPRIAGTAASPVNTLTTAGGYARVLILSPGESVDPDKCAAYFRTGTASRPATNVPFTVTVKAMDRYGNVLTGQADTFRLAETNGVPATVGGSVALASGSASLPVTYTNYGSSILSAVGRRLVGYRPIPVAGVLRTWTAGAGTVDWHTNGNWSPAAVPMQLDSVLVPVAAPLDPVLSANVQIGGVTVEDGASLNLTAFDMTASANVKAGLTGGVTNSTGRLFLSGIASTVEGKVPTLRVNGTYSLTANVNARAPILVDAGRLTASGFRLQADSQ
jgi:hypothetical protein